VTGPEHPTESDVPRWPRSRDGWIAAGWILAVACLLLGFFVGGIVVGIGVWMAIRGRRAAYVVIVVGVVIAFTPRLILVVVLDGKTYRIPSAAMEPTLKVGDRIFTQGDDSPERGDLFVFHPPAGAESDYGNRCGAPKGARQACAAPAGRRADASFVKRVVALPGDRLKIVGNRAHVNGRPLDEPYIRTQPCDDVGTATCNLPKEITIPPDHYFMLGDNRGQSDDSRVWGPVRRDWLVGRPTFRYWPLSRFGSL
jgi:signal peptidase I